MTAKSPSLFEEAENLLKKAKRKADHVQINVFRTKEEVLNINESKIDDYEASESSGIYLKLFCGKHMGLAYANHISDSLIDRAIHMAKATAKLEFFHGLPGKEDYPKPRIFDPQVAMLDEDRVRCLSEELIQEAKDRKIFLDHASVGFSKTKSLILNSNGVAINSESTYYSNYADMIYLGGREKIEDSVVERKMFEPSRFLQRTGLVTSCKTMPKKAPSGKCTVILSPGVFSELLRSALLPSFHAEAQGQSMLRNRLGKRIVDSSLSIENNATMDDGVLSARTDYEGSRARDTLLIDKGAMSNILCDFNTAKEMKVEPTGSADETGTATNNIIVSGAVEKNILSSVKKGIIISRILGIDNTESSTSEFSIEIDWGFLVKNGEILYPVEGRPITANLLDLLNTSVTLGTDTENNSAVYCPSVRIPNVRVG